MKWKPVDVKDPWKRGVNVLTRTVVEGKVVWVGTKAKRHRRKRDLTEKEKALVKRLMRGQGYEGPWGESASKPAKEIQRRNSKNK